MSEDIIKCLSCSKAKCDDCIGNRKKKNEEKKRNKQFELGDESHSLTEWAKILKINYPTLVSRINKGLEINEMLEAKIYLHTLNKIA